jgi:hypothetical protein
MLDIDRILGRNRLMRAMTGLNRTGFEALLPSFAVAYEAQTGAATAAALQI